MTWYQYWFIGLVIIQIINLICSIVKYNNTHSEYFGLFMTWLVLGGLYSIVFGSITFTPDEKQTFTFWGMLFASTPYIIGSFLGFFDEIFSISEILYNYTKKIFRILGS